MLAALATATPLLLLPAGSPSQLRMSHACTQRGAALHLGPGRIKRADLDAAIAQLTTHDSFQAMADDLAAEIAAMSAPQATIPFLTSLVTDGPHVQRA